MGPTFDKKAAAMKDFSFEARRLGRKASGQKPGSRSFEIYRSSGQEAKNLAKSAEDVASAGSPRRTSMTSALYSQKRKEGRMGQSLAYHIGRFDALTQSGRGV